MKSAHESFDTVERVTDFDLLNIRADIQFFNHIAKPLSLDRTVATKRDLTFWCKYSRLLIIHAEMLPNWS